MKELSDKNQSICRNNIIFGYNIIIVAQKGLVDYGEEDIEVI